LQQIDQKHESFFSKLSESGGKLRVRNALNPILWLCAIVATPCFLVIGTTPNPPVVVQTLLTAVVGTAIFGFIYLLIFDRDRLQSEEFLLKTKTLELIEEKGSQQAIDAATVATITQADFLALPDNREVVEQ
jgi:hypothetical protein